MVYSQNIIMLIRHNNITYIYIMIVAMSLLSIWLCLKMVYPSKITFQVQKCWWTTRFSAAAFSGQTSQTHDRRAQKARPKFKKFAKWLPSTTWLQRGQRVERFKSQPEMQSRWKACLHGSCKTYQVLFDPNSDRVLGLNWKQGWLNFYQHGGLKPSKTYKRVRK